MSEKAHMSIRIDSKLADWIDECVENGTLGNRSSGIEFIVWFFRNLCIQHNVWKANMTKREQAILPFTQEKFELMSTLDELFYSEGLTEKYEELEKDFCERFNVPVEKFRLRKEVPGYGQEERKKMEGIGQEMRKEIDGIEEE